MQEDRALRRIIMDLKISKWSQVAKLMHEQFSIEGRTGKQCR